VWLVASICMNCRPSPAGTYYCSRHNLDDKFDKGGRTWRG